MQKYTKYLLILFFAIVIAKIALSLSVPTISGYNDEYFYAKMARNFFLDGEFTVHGEAVAQYTPLYSILISPSYVFTDMSNVYFFMKLINALLSSLIIFPAWLLAREFLKEKKAFLTAVLVGVFPANFAISTYIMSENLFYPLFLFAIFALYKSMVGENYKWVVIAGILSGLAYLTKVSGFALLIIAFATYGFSAFRNKDYSTQTKKSMIFFLLFAAIASLWLIRNGMLYGFTLNGMLANYYRVELSHGFKFWNLSLWFLLYLGYVALASIFIYPLSSLKLLGKKAYAKMTWLFGISIVLTLGIAANHNAGAVVMNSIATWLPARPLGRYVDIIIPLVLITGMVGLEQKIKLNKRWLIPLGIIVVFSTFLTLFSLFPLNNMSLTWLGFLSKAADYVFTISPFTLVLFAVLLSALLFIAYKLLQKDAKKLVYLSIIFFLLLGLANYAVISWNSKTHWADGPQIKLGMFMNEYDPGTSIILLDERDEAPILKNAQIGVWEKLSWDYTSSIIGFWLNDKIVIGNPEDYEGDVDYIYTKHTLDKELVKQEGDFKIYSTKDL